MRRFLNGILSRVVQLASLTADPAGAADGMLWYDSGLGKFRKRQAGATSDLVPAGGGSGDVIGPASAVNNAVALFDTATGKLLKNSSVTISANGTLSIVATNTGFAGLVMTPGVLMTTPAVGTFEMDANCIYMTTDDGNRGVNLIEHFIRADVARTLSNVSTEQALFNVPAGGTLTLETGTYFFECLYSLSAMSATSGNSAFDLQGAGNAVLGTVLYYASGIDGATATAAAQTGSTSTTAQSAASIVTAGTATAQQTHVTGTFEVTTAGSIQPAITLVTASAAVLAAGSYFRCRRIGSSTVTSVGQWT